MSLFTCYNAKCEGCSITYQKFKTMNSKEENVLPFYPGLWIVLLRQRLNDKKNENHDTHDNHKTHQFMSQLLGTQKSQQMLVHCLHAAAQSSDT